MKNKKIEAVKHPLLRFCIIAMVAITGMLSSCNDPGLTDLYIKLPINSNDISIHLDTSNSGGNYTYYCTTYFNSDSIIQKYGIDSAKINKLILSNVDIVLDSNYANSEKNLNFINSMRFASVLDSNSEICSGDIVRNSMISSFKSEYDIRAFKKPNHSYILKLIQRKKVEDVKLNIILSYQVDAALASGK